MVRFPRMFMPRRPPAVVPLVTSPLAYDMLMALSGDPGSATDEPTRPPAQLPHALGFGGGTGSDAVTAPVANELEIVTRSVAFKPDCMKPTSPPTSPLSPG